MTLIHDIQAEAIDATSSVSSLLRKCMLLAARVSHEELRTWVNAELNGYAAGAPLPEYRVFQALTYGSFVGPYGMQAERLQVPASVIPEEHRAKFREVRFEEAISSLESLVQGDKPPSVQLAWNQDFALHYCSKATPNMQCIAAWREIPIGTIDRLLNSVKNAVLAYAIELERIAPDAGESPVGATPISEEKLTQIFHTHITGNVGNVSAGGTGFTQQAVVNGAAGDWGALRASLHALGVVDADLEGLKQDLDDARAAGTGMAGKPGEWLGRLMGKASTGAVAVGVEIAAAGVAKALAAYLGLS